MDLQTELNGLLTKFSSLVSQSIPDLFVNPPEWEGRTSTLVVTDDCNLRCTYCYITHKTKDAMTWDVAKKFIDMTFKNNEHLAGIPISDQTQFDHAKIWDFVGGEPFLESDLVFKCMEYIIGKTNALPGMHPWRRGFMCKTCSPSHPILGFRFSFSTNGTLLNDPIIRQNLEKYEKYTSLGVTIDGPKDMHDLCRVYSNEFGNVGSYATVMHNWDWYRKTFPDNATNTKSTICHENLAYINTIAKFFWEDLNMSYISMNCVFENVWHRGDQLILFDQLCDLADYLLLDNRWKRKGIRWFNPILGTKDDNNGKWCGAGTHMDACGWDGSLHPCLRFKTLDNYPSYKVGHVDDGKKDAAILANFDVKNCHITNIQKEVTGVDCAACQVSSLCSSCQAFSYDTYGRLDVKAAFICPMHKANVLANMYFIGNLVGVLTKNDRDYLMLLLDDFTKDDYFGFDENGTSIPMYKNKE